MKILFSFLGLCCWIAASAQGNVGIGTLSPHPRAALEIKSTDKGVLMPRLSTGNRMSMTNIPKGLLVYDSSFNAFYFHDGGRWRPVSEPNADSMLADLTYSPGEVISMPVNNTMYTTANSGILYDDGGDAGNYSASGNSTYAVYTDVNEDSMVMLGYKVIVEEMNTESPYDSLEIFLDRNYAGRQVFSGNRTGTFFFETNRDPLLFVFTSNNVNQLSGFKIRWSKIFGNRAAAEPPPLYGWYFNPKKMAVRGGLNFQKEWETDSMGALSFGYGSNNKITGIGSTAFGAQNKIRGNSVFLTGNGNTSNADASIVMGFSNVSDSTNEGEGNIAIGYKVTAYRDAAVVIGDGSHATNQFAVAIGRSVRSGGIGSVAIGNSANASGNYSVALGRLTVSSAFSSTALGFETNATATGATATGYQTRAIGANSFTANRGNIAVALNSTALGDSSVASGISSLAAGFKCGAAGNYSTATGYGTLASGANGSFATGYFTQATGISSFTANYGTVASGTNAFATGQSSVASGAVSTAMGHTNNVSGFGAVGIGSFSNISGNWANSIGTGLTVEAIYATAIGSKITIPPHAEGAMGLGDLEYSNGAVDNTYIDAPNQLVARFRGGYFFMSTANAPGGTESNRRGVKILPGQNSWSAISDVHQKENFEPINGELLLEKIARFKLSTWNYKGQDPGEFRHYGPMAQDFFAAFGHDKHGVIGCDTLINQQDFLGVSFAAIQALEKRTNADGEEIKILKQQVEALRQSNAILLKKLEASAQKDRR